MRIHNIFISHSWSYDNHYENIINLLKQATYFEFRDYSVPKGDPIHQSSDSDLRQAIKRQMQPASVVIVLAGVYSSYSKWIEIEVDLAKKHFSSPKKLVAVELWGSDRTSAYVKENADKVVGWNGQSIANTIKEQTQSDE